MGVSNTYAKLARRAQPAYPHRHGLEYDQVAKMEDINGDFGAADIAFVLGANDVVNPLAEQKGSPIYGMPILDAHKARTVVVNKRSMGPVPSDRAVVSDGPYTGI